MTADLQQTKKYAVIVTAGIAIVTVALYQYLFWPSVMEKGLKNLVERNTDAVLEMKLKRSSLFFGFEANAVRLYSKIDKRPIFIAKRINLSFFLPSLFAGHAGIRELNLEEPELFITFANGRWNYESLFKSKQSEKKTETETTTVNEPLPESVSTLFPIKLYLNFLVQKLKFHYSVDAPGAKTSMSAGNINLKLTAITSTFRTVPLNTDIINLLNTVVFAMNPFDDITFEYSDTKIIRGTPHLQMILFHDQGSQRADFASRFAFDLSKVTVFRANRMMLPLDFSLSYEAIYQPKNDRLHIKRFQIHNGPQTWLSFTADIGNISSPSREMDIRIAPTQIHFAPLSTMLGSVFPANAPFMRGLLSLGPLRIAGKPENLHVKGIINGEGLLYTDRSSSHNVPFLSADIDAFIDLFPLFPFLAKPESYQKKELAFGLFHSLDLPALQLRYNGSILKADVQIAPETGIRSRVLLSHFTVDPFTAPDLTGQASADMTLFSTESFNDIRFNGNLFLDNLRFASGRSVSGINRISGNADGALHFKENTTEIALAKFHLQDSDVDGNNMFDASGNGTLLVDTGLRFRFRFDRFLLDGAKFLPTLPGEIRDILAPYSLYLSKGIEMTRSFIDLGITENDMTLVTDMNLNIPFLRLDDLSLKMNLFMNERLIRFSSFQMKALKNALSGNAQGTLLFLPDGIKPLMKADFTIASKKTFRIHPNLSLDGNVKFRIETDRQNANGLLSMKDLNIQFEGDRCENHTSPDCRKFRIEKLNFDFPIHHSFLTTNRKHVPAASATAHGFYGGRADPNLTVQYLASSHNPRGEYKPYAHFFFGSVTEQKPGLSASIEYVNNTLHINWFEILMYKPLRTKQGLKIVQEGLIDGEDLSLSLGDLNPEGMTFGGKVRIKNLDLEPFLPRSRSNYDGIISGDFDFSGKNLDDPLAQTTARLSIHRLSPQFSGFATRIVMPDPIAAKIVQGTLKIPSILLELKQGLVYSKINIERAGILSGAIRPSGEEISQERVPLAAFLKRARDEASRFGE